MKRYRIVKYQVVYENNASDTIRLYVPICTNDCEAERTKLLNKHKGLGKKPVGVNLDLEEMY